MPTIHLPAPSLVALTVPCLLLDANYSGQIEADAARAEGTTVYAVGVGSVPEDTLLSIGGDPANVFDASDFTELDSECAGWGLFVFSSSPLHYLLLLGPLSLLEAIRI